MGPTLRIMITISCAAVRIGRAYLRRRRSVSYLGFPFMESSDVSCATCTRSASRGLGFLWSDTSPCLCRAFRCLRQVGAALPGPRGLWWIEEPVCLSCFAGMSIFRYFMQSAVGVGQTTRSAFVSSYDISSTPQGGQVVHCLRPPVFIIDISSAFRTWPTITPGFVVTPPSHAN